MIDGVALVAIGTPAVADGGTRLGGTVGSGVLVETVVVGADMAVLVGGAAVLVIVAVSPSGAAAGR